MEKHQYVFKITDRGLEHCMCFDLAQLPLTDVQRIKAAVSSGRSKQYQPTGTYNVNPLYWVSKCGFGTQ